MKFLNTLIFIVVVFLIVLFVIGCSKPANTSGYELCDIYTPDRNFYSVDKNTVMFDNNNYILSFIDEGRSISTNSFTTRCDGEHLNFNLQTIPNEDNYGN